jgi:hypothetical protein
MSPSYSHVWPDSEDRTLAAVDSVLLCRSGVTPSQADGIEAGQRG